MIPSLLSVAIMLAAPAATAEAPKGYQFEGQLGFRDGDGLFHALLPDAVFVGEDEGGCGLGAQSSETLLFLPDGSFEITTSTTTTSTEIRVNPDGSMTQLAPTKATVHWRCYRFRAEGCVDKVVQFGPTPPARRIEMECPGRITTLRADL